MFLLLGHVLLCSLSGMLLEGKAGVVKRSVVGCCFEGSKLNSTIHACIDLICITLKPSPLHHMYAQTQCVLLMYHPRCDPV